MDEQIKRLIAEASKEQRGVTVLNTVEQLKEFYLSNIQNYKEWRAFASIEDWLPVDVDFLQDFRVKLSEAGVDTKVIFKEAGLRHETQNLPYRQIKIVPDSYRFKSSIDILEDKMLIMNPHQTVLGLVIESKILVDVFVDMFDMLWNLLPEQKHE